MKHIKKFRNYPPSVVVGLSITGLGTVRALSRSGVSVIGVDSSFNQPSAHTRYCKKISCKNINEEEELLETLIEISKKNIAKPVLFLSTDMSVLIASENREFLRDYYYFNLPSKTDVLALMYKTLFSDFAIKNGFQIPETFVVDSKLSLQSVSKNIPYPCIMKPSYRNPTWDKSTPIKVFKAFSEEELINIYNKNSLLSEKMIIQELIQGPDSEVYFCLLWYNSLSQPIASFVGRKVMQWLPEFGSTCIAESFTSNDSIKKESIKLFNAVHYKGIGSVEFKKDPRNGVFKIIEPTVGRADLQSAIAYHSGINIPLLEYCDCLGLKLPDIGHKKKNVFWINEENLLWILGNERKRYPRKLWFRIVKGRKHYALFDISDLVPFFRFLLWIIKFVFNKIKNRWKMLEDLRKGGEI